MNILFFVFSFLLIFSFFNHLLLKNSHFFSQQKNAFCKYVDAKQALQNKFEAYKHLSYIKSQEPPTQKKGSLPRQIKQPFLSHRFKTNLPLLGKWNLSPVLQENLMTPSLLCEYTENLFCELYGHASFWKKAETHKPDLAKALVRALVEKGKIQASPTSFSALFPDDPVLQEVFYKILKGSGLYDLGNQKGYPPLEDFFCLEEKEKKLLTFSQSSFFALKALFPLKVVEEILRLEEEKWEKDGYYHSLTKQELQTLCSKHGMVEFSQIESILSFSRKTGKLSHVTHQNNSQNIRMKQPIF